MVGLACFLKLPERFTLFQHVSAFFEKSIKDKKFREELSGRGGVKSLVVLQNACVFV